MIWDRDQVVSEVLSWIGTPYHKGARLKGVGVDCGLFPLEIFLRAGFLSPSDADELERLAPVNQDWFHHAVDEKYLKLVIRHARHVLTAISYPTIREKALPGCIAVTRHAPSGVHHYNHGGIVTQWPRLVHAVSPRVKEIDVTKDSMWCYREVMIFDPWLKAAAK